MSDFKSKINYLNQLKNMGIEYYCSNDKDHAALHKAFFSHDHSKEKAEAHNPQIPSRDDFKDGNIGLSMQQTQTPQADNNNSPISTARRLADSATTIENLREIVMNFELCNLKKLAINTVFSDGNPNADYMFIGEAPGATEDKMGIPFCGESGKLLDNILASINVSRKTNAYITNTVFWRPPANRAPTQEEIDICRPFVEKHIALIKPKIIILVGSVAATGLLGKHAGITRIRQEYYSYSNQYLSAPITTTSIFHPAYLLRQPMQKKTTWYDLLKIKHYVRENKILEQVRS